MCEPKLRIPARFVSILCTDGLEPLLGAALARVRNDGQWDFLRRHPISSGHQLGHVAFARNSRVARAQRGSMMCGMMEFTPFSQPFVTETRLKPVLDDGRTHTYHWPT